jgi:hypothetical protein
MAQGDLNQDGLEDLIIGATNMLPTTVLLRKNHEFVKASFEGLTTQKPFSESDLAILDIEGDGDMDVISLAGGYENKKEEEYMHYLYENRNGVFIQTALPIPPFPASVLRPFDFDHDGDMDLFVASRVKKDMFPYANHSWLIINDKGRLSVNASSRLNLGMVTDAVWSDYDKDGWEDLMVAREYNSIAPVRNMQGKELIPQVMDVMEKHRGIWYSLAAGDFDQDGDDDYIAGNLGENHRFHVSEQYPLQVYAIDLDLDGIIDPITTAYWKDKNEIMKEYPVNYLDELWAQSTFFQKKFNTYKDFSYASIDEMLNDSILKKLEFKLHAGTTSSHIIWNDDGNLRWEKLPVAAQVSPIRKMLVRDFNNDRLPDVLLSGNDYTYDVATGYYDALKGLVLINKGRGAFELLPPSRSGILLQGMIGSLLFLEGDTSFIVAGMNRDQVNVFKLRSPD